MGLVGTAFTWVAPDPQTLALLIVAGLVGGAGQLLVTESLRVASIGVLAPYDYLQLVWAGLISLMIWGAAPDGVTLIGAAIVAGSGGYIAYRELKLARLREGRLSLERVSKAMPTS